jgi:hypothetical protein
MQTILDIYIERDIVEPSQSSWNAPAFLIKKQYGPEETNDSKIMLAVTTRTIAQLTFDKAITTPLLNLVIARKQPFQQVDTQVSCNIVSCHRD